MMRYPLLLLTAVLWISGSSATAAVKGPPPPKEYQVKLRYSILAARDQHVREYDALIKYLRSVGFKFDAGPNTNREDASKNYLEGTIASAKVGKLFGNPHVKAVLLLPPRYKLPAKRTDLVKVRLTLASGFRPDRQRDLNYQVRVRLTKLGFQEGIAYDHHNFTQVVGTLPAGQVETLLRDLRDQPGGWLGPEVPRKELPRPLRNVSPIKITEVIPEPATVTPVVAQPSHRDAQAENLEKLSRDLRDLLAKPENRTKRYRLEVILTQVPKDTDGGWRRLLSREAPSLIVEGRLGPLVTGTALLGEARDLARLDDVSSVRLPRPARAQLIPPKGSAADNSKALRALGVYKIGIPRKGVRVAVVDSDFRGYEALVKNKQLPPQTRYVDLTAERNPSLLPDPVPGDPQELGHGTRCALALAHALAGAAKEFFLVRIDADTPYQLQEVARYINGEAYRSESIARRVDELSIARQTLRRRRIDLRVERKAALDNFSQDEAILEMRKAYFKKEKQLQADERAYHERELRYQRLREDLTALKGVQVVTCSLVWNVGYPVDGSSALSRYFDERPFKAALWFQSAGNTGGQTWSGLYRDTDGTGVMDFAGPDVPLPRDRWTRKLNFLAWQPFGKPRALDLPAGLTLRVTVQWREPHDPSYLRRGEDLYRTPLAELRMVLLRQRDPEGKDLPTDDMEEVANSPVYNKHADPPRLERYGLPERLANYPGYAIYEQTLEFTTPKAGRYALSVEGKVPRGIRPAGEPNLPALEKGWEMRPRFFLKAADDRSRARGRPVFLDFVSGAGSLGMPADARRVITVGAADRSGKPLPYSATGPAMNLDLLPKPNLLVLDDGRFGKEGAAAYGTSLAAPAAAGLAARDLFGGTTRTEYLRGVRARPGKFLRVP
jgi:hypothetical protein